MLNRFNKKIQLGDAVGNIKRDRNYKMKPNRNSGPENYNCWHENYLEVFNSRSEQSRRQNQQIWI